MSPLLFEYTTRAGGVKKNILPIILIALTSIFVWHKILFQALLGEGYYYFDPGQNFFLPGFRLQRIQTYLSSYDNLPRLVFDILPPIFEDNLMFYQGFEILNIAILTIVLYFVVDYFIKNKWVSFMTTFLFSTSYVGLFEMIATGNYQRFIQRIPNFIFLFISFLYLAKYIDTKSLKYYFISISIFIFTVFMAHYSTFLLPLFVIYPMAKLISAKGKLKNFHKYLALSISYFVINFLIIKTDFYNPGFKPLSVFSIKNDVFNLILLQVSSITYPPSLLKSISAISQPYTKTVSYLAIPIIIFYVSGIYLVKKKEGKLLAFYLTSLLSLFSILFLNSRIGKIDYGTFFRGDRYYFVPFETLSQLGVSFVGGSRYYVLPIIFNSIIFSLVLWIMFKGRVKVFYYLTSSLLTVYFIYNTSLIWKEIDQIQPLSERMKIYLSYTKSIADKLKKAEVVATPPEFIWAGQFVRLFYGNEDLRFVPLKDGWQKEIDQETLKQTIVLGFDEEAGKIHEKKY